MFFRFGAALSLVVLVALSGTTLEKHNLQLKRAITHQQYRLDALLDSHVRLRSGLEAQRLEHAGATAGSAGTGRTSTSPTSKTSTERTNAELRC